MRTHLLAPLALAALLALTGCGGDAEADPDTTPSANPSSSSLAVEEPAVPACADVWKDGATLPADYEGCTNEDGSVEAFAGMPCDSGIGTFATYQDRFHALTGGPITEAPSESAEYAQAYEECFADPE